LTPAIIEFFAVPCAIVGPALYPLGLDRLILNYLGLGIDLVTYLAGLMASAPGASLHVKNFAPGSLIFLALALLSLVLWRSWLLRALAVHFVALGLLGVSSGESFDLAVSATGEAAAIRLPSRELAMLGNKPSGFVAEQWLRDDAQTGARRPMRAGASPATMRAAWHAWSMGAPCHLCSSARRRSRIARAAFVVTQLMRRRDAEPRWRSTGDALPKRAP
jgi:competence protein ComEC